MLLLALRTSALLPGIALVLGLLPVALAPHSAAAGALVRMRWPLLLAFTALAVAAQAPDGALDWDYFTYGSTLLLHPQAALASAHDFVPHAASGRTGGLALYAHYPQLQIGPVALLAVAALRRVAGSGPAATQVLSIGLGLLAVGLVGRLALRLSPRPPAVTRLVLACLAPALMWAWLRVGVAWTHPDDAIALDALLAGLLVVLRAGPTAPLLLGASIALAVDAKPWGILGAGLLAALPQGRRTAVGALVAGVALAWGPFVLAHPDTLSAGAYALRLHPDSLVGLLDPAARVTPHWLRPLQLTTCCLAVAVCVRRGHVAAFLLAAVAVRMLLDPNAVEYYAAGLVCGAVLLDAASARLVPVATMVALGVFDVVVPGLGLGVSTAVLRQLALVALLAVAARRTPLVHLAGGSVLRSEQPAVACGAT